MFRRRLLFVTVFFFLVTSVACGLSSDIPLTQYRHSIVKTDSGMPSDNIRVLMQTKDGYLWAGTPAALVRFNGTRPQLYSRATVPEFSVDAITALLQDREGSLWIGTQGGGLLSFRDNHFTRYGETEGMSADSVTALAQDFEGNLWIATPKQLDVFKKGEFLQYQLPAPVRALLSNDRSLLVGTDAGISTFDGKNFGHAPGNAVTAFYKDSDGTIWMATEKEGLGRMQGGKFQLVAQTADRIRCMIRDHDKTTWVGTDHGLYRLKGASLEAYPYIHVSVNSLLEDHEGSLWIGTSGEGLHILAPTPFLTLGTEEGLIDNRSNCLVQDEENNFWFGTDRGISRWKDGVAANYATESSIIAISQNANQIWAATNEELLRWNGAQFIRAASVPSIRTMLADADGIWLGTANGLFFFSNGKMEKHSDGDIRTIYRDPQNTLWLGTSQGLNRWIDQSWKPYLVVDSILSLLKDREGNLWAGTVDGVKCIRNGKVISYTARSGFYDDIVFSILQDNNNHIWMAGSRGVFRLERKRNGEYFSIPYNAFSGFRSTETSSGQPSAWKASDGRLWFATRNGVSVVNPSGYFVNKVPPPVQIEGISADRSVVKDFRKKPLVLFRGTTQVEILYSALSFLEPHGVKFRYVLQGFDHYWTNAGGRRSAFYTNLPPGKYRFKVLACNNDEIWNTTGDSLEFEIPSAGIAAFRWSTLLAPIATLLIGFAAGWWIARRRIARP